MWAAAPGVLDTAHDGGARPKHALGCHRPQQSLERDLHVLAPGERRSQFHPEPRVAVMRPYGLEPDREQEVDRQHTAGCGPLLVTERFDRPHSAPGEIL